jgi:hypothetical protein
MRHQTPLCLEIDGVGDVIHEERRDVAGPDRRHDETRAGFTSAYCSYAESRNRTAGLEQEEDYLTFVRALRRSAQYRFIRSETALRAASDMCWVRFDARFRD